MTPGAAVRALMTGAIDYAGLFPPAGLGMPDAVARFAAYRRGAHAWMLGRFVVPVARLGELGEAMAAVAHDGTPWPVSAIARPADAATLAAFNAAHVGRAVIDMVEVPPVTAADAAGLGVLARAYATYAEVPIAEDPAPVIRALRDVGARAKVRTGGITADAFPPAAHIARFIVACHDAGVAFKATAGLHHVVRAEYPLTYEPGCARGTMYGFANMLLAATAGFISVYVPDFGAAGDVAQIETARLILSVGVGSFAGLLAAGAAVPPLRCGLRDLLPGDRALRRGAVAADSV